MYEKLDSALCEDNLNFQMRQYATSIHIIIVNESFRIQHINKNQTEIHKGSNYFQCKDGIGYKTYFIARQHLNGICWR